MTFKEFMEGKFSESIAEGFSVGENGKKKYFSIDRRKTGSLTIFLLRDEIGRVRYVDPKDIIRL